MAYNQALAERVRIALAHIPAVEEKKMFGSLAFMVNSKARPCTKFQSEIGDKRRLTQRVHPIKPAEYLAIRNCR